MVAGIGVDENTGHTRDHGKAPRDLPRTAAKETRSDGFTIAIASASSAERRRDISEELTAQGDRHAIAKRGKRDR